MFVYKSVERVNDSNLVIYLYLMDLWFYNSLIWKGISMLIVCVFNFRACNCLWLTSSYNNAILTKKRYWARQNFIITLNLLNILSTTINIIITYTVPSIHVGTSIELSMDLVWIGSILIHILTHLFLPNSNLELIIFGFFGTWSKSGSVR